MRLALLLAMLVAMPSLADVASGPKVGDEVAKLKAFGVTGLVEGKEADFAAERKDEPTLYVFIQREHWTRPMAQFLKGLDAGVVKADEKAKVVVVFLGDDRDAIKEYLPKANTSLQFENTSLAVFLGDKAGPEGWGVNADAHLTAVVVKGKKVVASEGYQSVNGTDAKKVIEKFGN